MPQQRPGGCADLTLMGQACRTLSGPDDGGIARKWSVSSNTIERVVLSKLIAYENAIVMGKLTATVTDSGIVLIGRVRLNRDNDFRICVTPLLRQLAVDLEDEEVSGFVADVFDRTLAHGFLAEGGDVRFFPAHTGEPSLQARTLLVAAADRIAKRWPYRPGAWTP